MQIFHKKKIIILTIFLALFFVISLAAASNSILKNPQITSKIPEIPFQKYATNMKIPEKIPTTKTHKYNPKTQTKTANNGCCSVFLHVKDGYDIFSYRRDSTYQVNLYFTNIKWYNKKAIKEYKTVNGYSFHTIISRDGWIVSAGGSDIPQLNKELENLAGKTSNSGHITSGTVNKAYKILKKMGIGHFLIKSPDNTIGIVIYNNGALKKTVFKIHDGEYVSVPNHPIYYRNGYASIRNPILSAINLETTDRWGINRRNIITYEIMNHKEKVYYSTLVKIWASNCRGTPDNIIYNGHLIKGNRLPKIPKIKFIGQVNLK
ncbi:MAG: hypothetical protein PHY59_07540 [Methanobacterium sp.]|nr:hypothetical protein [Methanobacterium sp.]